MWVCLAFLLTLAPSGMWVLGDAQVLITHRGVPAPFPHFPKVNPVAEPESEEEPDPDLESNFQFAPTPTGRAAPVSETTPEPPTFLATPAVPEDVPQSLGILFCFAFPFLYKKELLQGTASVLSFQGCM